MNQLVTELKIVGSDNNIFDTDMEYVIPLYQRAYAWEDKQLTQLVEDIDDVAEDTNYYIGALIVSKQGNKFEVVDGQQRLTSLYLLLNCLGLDVKNTLTFACRERSNYSLRNITELLSDERDKFEPDRLEPGIVRGIHILRELLNKEDFDRESFIEKMKRVVVYRIEVPENTDLNRYFEIMNTRGEQLEQHDILKATLMGYLHDRHEAAVFAKIWDACSDMTGYVQMHFVSKGNVVRENIFGGGWNYMPSAKWDVYKNSIEVKDLEGAGHKINEIIDVNFRMDEDDGFVDDDTRVRFESIIDFPYFLLHTLKVFVGINGIEHENTEMPIVQELLDDKKLIDSFMRVIDHGVEGGLRIVNDKAEFTKDFVVCLLRTRYLFDKYILKREYANENSDGEWSLKSLEMSNKKPYYRNTKFASKGEWNQDQKNPDRVKENIMLQSALRVSYTSPKVMHWITKLLVWLSCAECTNIDRMADYRARAEDIARSAVIEQFFNVCKDGSFAMGVNTPHIVFNYLDYLIWNSDRKKYEDFIFEFRNSVEHWYPQNPSEGTFEQWKDGVDQFGNLCIIQRNVNSKFSNMSPEAKKSTFKDMIAKGSLKLRIMSSLTEKQGDKVASLCWKETIYKVHEKEMINMLMEACGVNSVIVFPDEEEENQQIYHLESNVGTSLNVASIMLEWAKGKENEGEIKLNLERCGKRFVRFTTDATSELLPEATEANSGWGTRTHYYYEILNDQGKKINMQFALSGLNLPNDLREVCNRINEHFPSRKQIENWQWRCPFVTKRIKLDPMTTKADLIKYLDELYSLIMDFEKRMLEELKNEY